MTVAEAGKGSGDERIASDDMDKRRWSWNGRKRVVGTSADDDDADAEERRRFNWLEAVARG